MRDSVLIYTENIDIISELTDEQAGVLLKAIMHYQVEGEEIYIDDPAARIAFLSIRKQIDRCNESYDETKRKRSEAGKKGMDKRWSDNTTITEDNTAITNDNTAITKDNTAITNDNTAITRDNTAGKSDNKNNINVPVNVPVKDKEKVKDIKHKHGEYKHILLSEGEYKALLQEYGKQTIDNAIRIVDEYCETSGKTYRNYNLVLRKWGIQQAQKGRSSPARSPGQVYDTPIYDFDAIEREMVNR